MKEITQGIVVIKPTHQTLLVLSLTVLLSSCASQQPTYYPENYPQIPESQPQPVSHYPTAPQLPSLPDLQTNYPSLPTLPRVPTNQPQPPRLPDLQTTYPSLPTLPRVPTNQPQPPRLPDLQTTYPNYPTQQPSNTYPSLPRLPTQTPQQPSSGAYSAATLTGAYANSNGMRQFIQNMVQKHGFSQYYLNGLFSQAIYLPRVAQLENPPQTMSFTTLTNDRGSWSRYREKFLTDRHINDGVSFWRKYATTLQQASTTYGVNPEYIVAIIGVETFFGKNVGKTLTIDALSTLAFNTPKRAKFFTSELENFLLIARDERIEPRKPLGSWAGAMGLGQFMPSSFRKLFVDFNRDGKRDLWHPEDVIGSVANYFSQQSGWRLNQAVAQQTNSPYGTDVIKLSTYNGDEYWKVYPNFKVITTYNHSDKYAMAVHQLAQAIKQRY